MSAVNKCAHVTLPSDEPRRLTFYLAMEEYLAQDAREDMFFLWQVSPTVIFGRNQVMEDEVNLDYCRKHGVDVVRRKSGGGCVYSDKGNIMLSYITPEVGVETVFPHFLDMVADALTGLGMPAVRTEHNDILVGGCKVSGNAFFALPSSSIVHGTMLYDTDFEAMSHAITPPREKLAKHGVQSVRQRVANLRELGLGMDIEAFKSYLTGRFCDREIRLNAGDVDKIRETELTYAKLL